MNYAKEDGKNIQTRAKSRKSFKSRNNSILTSNKKHLIREKIHEGIHSEPFSSLCSSITGPIDNLEQGNKVNSKIRELSNEKQNLLDIIQSNEKEFDFLNHIISQFIDLNEVMKIKQKSSYDEDSRTWDIPNFVVQQRKTVFPKLQRSQIKEAIQNDLKKKKIVIKPMEVEGYKECEEPSGRSSEFYCGEAEARPGTSISRHRPLHRYT